MIKVKIKTARQKAALRRKRGAFIVRLMLLKGEAFRLGLVQTGKALDQATVVYGWEAANDEQQAD